MAVRDNAAIRSELTKILSSPVFVNSPRMIRFLRYVVETTLEGNGGLIKEYVIAREVFEKPETYDPQADSTVRTEASKLRTGWAVTTKPRAGRTRWSSRFRRVATYRRSRTAGMEPHRRLPPIVRFRSRWLRR